MNTQSQTSTGRFKKIASIALLILVTAAICFVVYDFFRGGSSEDEGVIHATLHSAILGQDREVLIHLPRQYDSTRTYPVVYVLDGSSQDGHIAECFDKLSSAGQVPPAIVVGLPNMTQENRERQLVPPFMKTDAQKSDSPSGEGEKFLSFIENELFPFIAQNYATSQTRLFMGNSRAGLLVMYSLLYRPEIFHARFCFSTPFWRQDDILITKVSEFLRTKDSLRSFLFMSVGERETDNIKGGFDRMSATFKENAPVGFEWHAYQTPGSDHQINAQNSAAIGIVKWGEFIAK